MIKIIKNVYILLWLVTRGSLYPTHIWANRNPTPSPPAPITFTLNPRVEAFTSSLSVSLISLWLIVPKCLKGIIFSFESCYLILVDYN